VLSNGDVLVRRGGQLRDIEPLGLVATKATLGRGIDHWRDLHRRDLLVGSHARVHLPVVFVRWARKLGRGLGRCSSIGMARFTLPATRLPATPREIVPRPELLGFCGPI
jgi:hypothetical protein